MTSPVKIAIAGLGTVGLGVLDALAANGDHIAHAAGRSIKVTAVSARTRQARRGNHDLSSMTWFDDAAEMARAADVDVVVELIGGHEGVARATVENALKAGRHVVTANKALLAHHGSKLAQLAEEKGVSLNFEAAVAGGIPIVKAMRESLAGNRITRVFGILNGTCNYILTKMASEARDFADVLAEAQALGYAEADPTFDVGGFDAAHKLACLTSLAFAVRVDLDSVYVEGIENITLADIRNADSLGYRIKLLGVCLATDDGIEQRVHPALVPKSSPIANVDGVDNAVSIDGDFVGNLMLVGQGAGGAATASAVCADIVDIARGDLMAPFAVPASRLAPYKRARMRAHEGGYYVAIDLFDRPGEVAAVASIFADEGISIESIVQRAPGSEAGAGDVGATAPFILITHDTLESAMRASLERIGKEGHAAATPRMIRIERL